MASQKQRGTKARVKNLTDEGERLDQALKLTSEIVDSGQRTNSNLYAQQEKLKNSRRNLKKITHTVPGLDKLISMISRAKLKNTIILAFVIALCLAILIYSKGVQLTPAPQIVES